MPAELQRRIDHLERRIANATRQQAEREAWLTDHRSVVEERRVVGDAERAVEARIRHRPLVHLPAHVIAALGPEPDLQRERSAWSAAASATAIHRERHSVPVGAGDGLDGPAALLGERPADALAAASWDYAAAKVADIDVEQAIESGTGL